MMTPRPQARAPLGSQETGRGKAEASWQEAGTHLCSGLLLGGRVATGLPSTVSGLSSASLQAAS